MPNVQINGGEVLGFIEVTEDGGCGSIHKNSENNRSAGTKYGWKNGGKECRTCWEVREPRGIRWVPGALSHAGC